jgi:methylglutaconyl-CoA hydratase
MTSYTYLTYHCLNKIGYITLNRIDKRNALNALYVTELKQAFTHAYNDEACKVIVLKSNADVFCAGADLEYLKQLQNNTYEENYEDSSHLASMFEMIYAGPKVVIAQIEGHAIAGGCGLAAICDFSFAIPEANFAYTEVKIGFIPAIVMIFLIRKIGEGKARELLLGGHSITAAAAEKRGLINQVVSKDLIENEVTKLANRLISDNSSESMRLVKEMISKVQTMEVEHALDFAAQMNAKARATSDCKKGISAFLNKEKIVW